MPFLTIRRKAFAGEDDFLRVEQFVQISQKHAQCLVDFHLTRGNPVVIDGQYVVQDSIRLSGEENYIVIGHIDDAADNPPQHFTPNWAWVAYAVEVHCSSCNAVWDTRAPRHKFPKSEKLYINGEDFDPDEYYTLPIANAELTGVEVCMPCIKERRASIFDKISTIMGDDGEAFLVDVADHTGYSSYRLGVPAILKLTVENQAWLFVDGVLIDHIELIELLLTGGTVDWIPEAEVRILPALVGGPGVPVYSVL